MTRPGDPTGPTVKKLFALSDNRCAFQDFRSGTGCEAELARPEWPRTQGEIAHIHGEAPTSARYDAAMSDAERKAFENLMVLCPTHHHFIDYLEPDIYTVDVLVAMKQRHESQCRNKNWASDAQLAGYAKLILVVQFGVDPDLADYTMRDSPGISARVASDRAGGSDSATVPPEPAAGTARAYGAEPLTHPEPGLSPEWRQRADRAASIIPSGGVNQGAFKAAVVDALQSTKMRDDPMPAIINFAAAAVKRDAPDFVADYPDELMEI